MSSAYQDLARREKKVAESLAEDAQAIGMAALSASLSVVAKAAVRAVMKDDGRGNISEPASDLRALRTNPELLQAKDKDLTRAEAQYVKALIGAPAFIGVWPR